ncbi:MAG TPA: hypothetical protein PLB30_02885 [Thermoleophilia bacterium]|nr:hypothetical protein [Thermoleophilia bacterium]HQJ97484.1 hypothetical protein [Thermoleophilia bacterium]
MSLRSAARRLLDPWAGLLLAALIALGVVILMSAPGPWRLMGGAEAPLRVEPAEPSDIAVFVLAGPAGHRCTAVVWLHVDVRRPALTATLVAPDTRCPVTGSGYAPVRTLATDVSPAAAADALGEALGVTFAGWLTVERSGMERLFAATSELGAAPGGRAAFKTSMSAFAGRAVGTGVLARQRDALRRALRALPYAHVKANALVNYVLGSEDIATDLDLRKTTKLVEAVKAVSEGDVAVGVAAAIVETCGPAMSWRLDCSRLESLRLSLAFGLEAASPGPRVRRIRRAAEVLVVAPTSAVALAADLQDELGRAGALPVTVDAVVAGAEGVALSEAVRRRRPLAVVLVSGTTAEDVARLRDMGAALKTAFQPCVVVGDGRAGAGRAGDDALRKAAGPAPVVAVEVAGGADPSPSPGWLCAGDEARRCAARLIAGAVARSCWPEYLAPGLVGTRVGFSYAARRTVEVAVVGAGGLRLQPWLAACGYQVRETGGAAAGGPDGPAVVYRPGYRRAALTVAGDLPRPSLAVARDPAAPAAVTVSVPGE